MPVNTFLIPTRKPEEPCARCAHRADHHALGRVRSWEACRQHGCSCPGWCASIACATCDYGTPRWAGYSQCLGCLDARVLPSDYVIKNVLSFDTEAAIAEIRLFRGEWEVKHPGFTLDLDRQRSYPETVAPSRYSDRHTTLGRKLYAARFRVVRAHPRIHAPGGIIGIPMRDSRGWDGMIPRIVRREESPLLVS